MTRPAALLLAALLAGPLPLLAKRPVNAGGPFPEGACAVCGMHVANFPTWAAAIAFRDGRAAWFDGPKDLFTYLHDPKRFGVRPEGLDGATLQVKDYYALKAIDARKAFFVIGSDVMGPMGRELVPFATEAEAREFLRDHRGQKVLAFRDITPGTLKELE